MGKDDEPQALHPNWVERRAFLMTFLRANTGSGAAPETDDDSDPSQGEEDAPQRHSLEDIPPEDLTPTPEALKKIQDTLGLTEDKNTVGAARTTIPGLKKNGFFGLSPKLRRDAQQPDLDTLYGKDRDIKSPNRNSFASSHSEEDILNAVNVEIKAANLKDADLEGHIVDILISNEGGICNTCMGGLTEYKYKDGVIKQFSDKYPTLTIRITALGGDALQMTPVIDGKKVDKSRKVVLVRGGEMVDA